MSRSQNKHSLHLLRKKGKDRLFLEDWRPISRMEIDAKIMFNFIATRIQNVVLQIIYHNQTGLCG